MDSPKSTKSDTAISIPTKSTVTVIDSVAQPPPLFTPSLGSWAKPLKIIPEVGNNPQAPPPIETTTKGKSGGLPPALKPDGQLRFPWAAKMDSSIRNLRRTTTPSYMEDGTPKVHIPNHVLLQGIENQKQYVVGQFYQCRTPSGGLIHAMANRIWGKKCKIFSRKLSEFSYLFHIPDASTRNWVLERGLWHIDECIMFVAPWAHDATLALPEISSVPVWVTLKNIPSRCYSHVGISWIASGLGEPMLTNKPWLDPSLMGEAKLMVEIELEKGFPERILAEDKRGNVSWVDVEYSWLPNKCKKCGHLGHKESRCLLQGSSNTSVVVQVVSDVTNSELAPENIVVNCVAKEIVTANVVKESITNAAADEITRVVVADVVAPLVVTVHSALVTGDCNTTPSANQFNEAPVLISATCIEAGKPLSTVTGSENLALNKAPTADNSSSINALSNSAPISPMSIGPPCDMVNISTPLPQTDSFKTEQGIFGSNHFATFEPGAFGYEMGDASSSQTSRGGRQLKPSQKVKEMAWITVPGRGNRRGCRGRGSS